MGGGGVGGAAVLGPREGAPYLRFVSGAGLGFGQIRRFSSNLAYCEIRGHNLCYKSHRLILDRIRLIY